MSGVSRFDSSADGSNLSLVRIASIGFGGILGLVGLIAWSCITGHIATGIAGVIALPVWMASGCIYMSILVLRSSSSCYAKVKPQPEPEPMPRPQTRFAPRFNTTYIKA